jgi:hypothetical protein
MPLSLRFAVPLALVVVAVLALGIAAAGSGWRTVSQDFQSPLFGLNNSKGHALLVAESGAGPTLLNKNGETTLIAPLPGVTDVLQIGWRDYVAVTGEPDASFYRIQNDQVTKILSIIDWELANDPGGDNTVPPEDAISNPFDLARLGHQKFLVADAAGNSILKVGLDGSIDWVAVLPHQEVSTQYLKDAVGCPAGPPDLCGLPDTIPADPVPTTVEIGPGGDIYVGELKGFPATPGTSRVWKIQRDATHAQCDTDPRCAIMETGPLTSIMDIKFDGKTAYIVEADENGWLAAEEGQGVGGTVNACRVGRGGGDDGHDDDDDHARRNHWERWEGTAWKCKQVETGLPFPTAVALTWRHIYVTLMHGFEGPFEVAKLNRWGWWWHW